MEFGETALLSKLQLVTLADEALPPISGKQDDELAIWEGFWAPGGRSRNSVCCCQSNDRRDETKKDPAPASRVLDSDFKGL